MRATEIIRDLLDLIDKLDTAEDNSSLEEIPSPCDISYSNSPDIIIKDISSVTTDTGFGGTNGPKNPADIRSDSVSMYPAHQHKMGG